MNEADVLKGMVTEATEKLVGLKQAAEQLRERIALEERYVEELRRKQRASGRPSDDDHAHTNGAAGSAEKTLPVRIEEFLKSKDGPVRASDIATAIDAGLPSVISTLGRRTDLFIRVSRGCYALKVGPKS